MKLGSGRRTRSRADGRNAGPGHLRRATRGLRRPIFSVQSVRPKEKARGSSCPHAFDAVVIALVGERGREVREFLDEALAANRSIAVAIVATSDESPAI